MEANKPSAESNVDIVVPPTNPNIGFRTHILPGPPIYQDDYVRAALAELIEAKRKADERIKATDMLYRAWSVTLFLLLMITLFRSFGVFTTHCSYPR